MRAPPIPALFAGLIALTILLFAVSIAVGPTDIPVLTAAAAVLGLGGEEYSVIVDEIRIPRALLGAAVGASLGLAGAALQGLLRNPLAEPGLLGVGASASLGAALAIYTGLSLAFPLALPLCALAGASLAALFVLKLTEGLGHSRRGSIIVILAGIAISSFAGALTSLVLNFAPNPFAALEIVFWLLGSLANRSMTHVQLALPFMAAGWVMLFVIARPLDALTLGEDVAVSLGVNLTRTRALAVLGTAAAVGAATAVAGAIGFVGLIVPHVLRPLVGASPRLLLPASALGGAALLLAADVAVRAILPTKDLKLGVVTALVGAPFFLWLLFHARSKSA